MKKVNALVLGLMVLLASGCGGDGDEPTPDADPAIKPVVSGCKILMDSSLNEGTRRYTYDAQNKLVQIDRYNSSPSHSYETLNYGSNGKLNRLNTYYSNGMLDFYYIFEYNSMGQLSKYTRFGKTTPSHPFEEQAHWDLLFDLNGKLVERKVFTTPNAAFPARVFQYTHQADSIIIEKDFRDPTSSGNLQLIGTVESKYDNKKNPYANMGHAIIMNIFIDHNLVSVKYNNGLEIAYSYQYNAQGYPVKRRQINTAFLIEDICKYNCQ